MNSYRITKFNPQKRNAPGAYLDHSEWTSISDIGKEAYNYVTYEEYENTESAYVNAVKLILGENAVAALRVDDVEMHLVAAEFEKQKPNKNFRNLPVDFNELGSLQSGILVSGALLEKVVRLVLREIVWLKLWSDNLEVVFGYDYYMYEVV